MVKVPNEDVEYLLSGTEGSMSGVLIMIADEAIVDPDGIVDVEFPRIGEEKWPRDLFYILNAPVELQGDQIRERAERVPSIAALFAPTHVIQQRR